ncbi:hypothetical protein [Planomicrobium sp. CPCC 101110]|uniref:hypothetical protein n=1 Tax=Planomicrobium sp. CPCC 101110 TaxID=2599619 RepID=UPI0011B4C71C|nr:hypothetical protein [Planomicrobium sp. CPCC 101110]TWT27736.1 hypothetical protein FQV30_04280 [Planomicrobium sp. CPCC 101110]
MNKYEISIIALSVSLLSLVLPPIVYWPVAILAGIGLLIVLKKALRNKDNKRDAFYFLFLAAGSIGIFLFLFPLPHAALFCMLLFACASLMELYGTRRIAAEERQEHIAPAVRLSDEIAVAEVELKTEEMMRKLLAESNIEKLFTNLKEELAQRMESLDFSLNKQAANSLQLEIETKKLVEEFKKEQLGEIDSKIDRISRSVSNTLTFQQAEELHKKMSYFIDDKANHLVGDVTAEIKKQGDRSSKELVEMNLGISEVKEGVREANQSLVKLVHLQNQYTYTKKEEDLTEEEWRAILNQIHEIALEMKDRSKTDTVDYQVIKIEFKVRYPKLSEKGLNFLSTGEYLYQVHKGIDFDYAPIMVEFSKVIERELNLLLEKMQLGKNLTLGNINYLVADKKILVDKLRGIGSFLTELVKYRNGSAHVGESTQAKVEKVRSLLFDEGWIERIIKEK